MPCSAVALYKTTASTGCYITIDPNQQEMFYQKNPISTTLYDAGSKSVGAIMSVKPDQPDVI